MEVNKDQPENDQRLVFQSLQQQVRQLSQLELRESKVGRGSEENL